MRNLRSLLLILGFVGLSLAVGAPALARHGDVALEVVLQNPLARQKQLRFEIPEDLLSNQTKSELRKSRYVGTIQLRITFKEVAERSKGASTLLDASRLSSGVRVFLQIPRFDTETDYGQWRLERFRQRDLEGKPQDEVKEVTVDGKQAWTYQISGSLEIYALWYRNNAGKVTYFRCFGYSCVGYKTWNGKVRLEYSFPLALRNNLVELESGIDALVGELYRKTN